MFRLCLLIVSLVFSASALAMPPTHEYTLNNGLKVLVREDHRAPVVTVMVWIKAGSIDQAPYETGLAHMLEHMMFRGTSNLAPGQYSRIVARYGGEANAFTSYDYTAYYQQYQKSRLPLALQLEADRMQNLKITDKDFYRELHVVMEERHQRVDDNPDALAWEKFQAVARAGTGYAHSLIGWSNPLSQLKPEQARSWYRRFYVPSNAVLVIAGDVTLKQVKPLVHKFFADIPAGKAPPRPKQTLNPVGGERRMVIHVPVKVPALYMMYNVPSLVTAKDKKTFYALTMLAGVLDGGMSSRIESDLVRGRHIAADANADYDGLQRGNGTFTFTASPNPGVSLDRLEKAMKGEIRKIARHPPGAAEMDRVRAGVEADKVYQRDSVMGQAMELGTLATLGLDWHLSENFSKNLAAVTPKDVQQAARQWLVADRSTVAHVMPKKGGKQTQKGGEPQ